MHQVGFIYKIKQDSLDKGRGRGDLTKSETGGSRRLKFKNCITENKQCDAERMHGRSQ